MKARVALHLLPLLASAGGCSSCFDRAQPAEPAPSAKQLAPRAGAEQGKRIRKAVFAGSWYPGDKEKLIPYLDGLLAAEPAPPKLEGNIVALVSPHAGYVYSGKAAAAGYRQLRGRDIRRVVILAVAHREPFQGASIIDATHYETPLGLVPVDHHAVARLRKCRVVRNAPEADEREHSLEIQLPLLQRVLPRFSLVPLLLSSMAEQDYVDLAAALADIVDAHTLVVASSDFTHRGGHFSYEVPAGSGSIKERLSKLDLGAVAEILKLDRRGLLGYERRTGATICGLRPIATLLELLARFKGAQPAPRVRGQVLAHYTSADVTGDWSTSVSYVDIAFTGAWPAESRHSMVGRASSALRAAALSEARSAGERVFPLSLAEKRALLALARASLEAAVRRGRFDLQVVKRHPATPSLERKAGAFVTLKCKQGPGSICSGKGDGLRGCIGTIVPVESVHATVAQRAASAALEDTRFPSKVGEAELRHITLEVSVLTPPRAVKGADEIVIGRHGIILSKEGRSATFLPQVAPEQGWDRDTTLRHLADKAGLDDWRGAAFQVYEAIVFGEGEL
jgi:AmmeMemoRadiSam system protein B/AmmeMemoRadiSam system protein A